MKALNIFIKNLKILIRSRSSALIIVFGPLLVILLVGMSFNTSGKYDLSVGVYKDSNNELTQSFITKMKEANLRVVDYSIKNDCIEDVKTADINICLYFPKMEISDNATSEIEFFVDPSKVNLVWVVMDAVSSKVSERSEELTRDMTQILTESLAVSQQEAESIKPKADAVYENLQVTKVKVKNTIDLLEALDLKFDMSTFNPENMTETSGKVNRTMEEFRVAGYEAVEKGWELVEYLQARESALQGTEGNNIKIKMGLVKNDLVALNQTLNRRGNFTNTGMEDMFALVGSIKTNLIAVHAQFEQIRSAKATMSVDLADANARLGNDLTDMSDVRASIANISNSIASVQVTNVGSIAKPVRTVIKPVVAEKTLLNYLFSSIIVLVVMFICLILSATLVVSEKNSLSSFRSAITPTSGLTFFLGTLVTVLFILALQMSIIFGVTIFFFKASFLVSNLAAIVAVIFLVVLTFTLVGMFLGHLMKTEETATLAAITVGSVMLFVSNLVLPLESIPEYARKIANYNPFVMGDSMLQSVSLFGAKLPSLLPEVKMLLIYCGALLVGIFLVTKLQKTHYMHRIGFKMFNRERKQKKDFSIRKK